MIWLEWEERAGQVFELKKGTPIRPRINLFSCPTRSTTFPCSPQDLCLHYVHKANAFVLVSVLYTVHDGMLVRETQGTVQSKSWGTSL